MEASSAKKWTLGKDSSSISVTDLQCELGQVSYPLWLTLQSLFAKLKNESISFGCTLPSPYKDVTLE